MGQHAHVLCACDHVQLTSSEAIVSSPDPTPKWRKGSGAHRALSGTCWHGISKFCCTNQINAMWLARDYHVTPRYSRLLLHVRAIDVLPCRDDALSWQSHDMLHPVRPKSAQCVPDPFLLLGMGSGDETTEVSDSMTLCINRTLCVTRYTWNVHINACAVGTVTIVTDAVLACWRAFNHRWCWRQWLLFNSKGTYG